MATKALIPNLISSSFAVSQLRTSSHLVESFVFSRKTSLYLELIALSLGVLLVYILSQIVIRLPWTPIPITGQTFGVALLALLWGSKRAFSVMGTYLFLGVLGVPVLAGGNSFLAAGSSIFSAGVSALTLSATSGYLIGMLAASFVVGKLSDLGWAQKWSTAFAAAVIGSVITFACGLFVLSYFVPSSGLLAAGLIPFLPGDLFKNILASFLVSRKLPHFTFDKSI